MSAKHTPGPWTHTGQGDITGIETNGENHGPVDVCCVYLRTVPGRTKANARLVAAAPELLEALQGVLRVADRKTDEFDAARAAIAKALGETT